MAGILDFFRGSVRVELRCRYSERAVNICARNHVDFRDLSRGEDGGLRMTVNLPGYMTLRRVSRETGAFTVRICSRRGVPFFLWRIRKRYVLLAGLVVCAALLALSSLYVWQIDVTGNVTVPTSRILAELRSQGVDIGTCLLDIRHYTLINRVLVDIPELSFITLNTHGSRIEVLCREEVPRPELYDPDRPTAVVAEKPGIITEITAAAGWTVRQPGDTVLAGDELISPWVPLGRGALTHASGRVWARTWYELTLKMPLGTSRKVYTGASRSRTAIILAGKRINIYFNSGNPYASCDKMTVYKKLTLPGGAVLPITLVRETFDEYRNVPGELSPEEAERILTVRLMEKLEGEIGEGYIVSREFETTRDAGTVTVTLRAECVEQIARERELTEEEIASFRTDGTD